MIILGYRDDRQALDLREGLVASGVPRSNVLTLVNAAPRVCQSHGSPDVLRLTHNLGYAGAMNLGLDLAAAQGWDIAALLTHDVQVSGSTLLDLATLLREVREIAVIGPLLDDEQGRFFSGGGGLHRGGVFHLGGEQRGLRDVDWIDGAVLVGKTQALRDVGGFDDRFFLYAEDVDLCLRLGRRGWRVAVSGDHRASQQVGGQSPERRRVTAYLSARNLLETYRKDGGRGSALGLAARQLRRIATGPDPLSLKTASLRGMLACPLRRFGPPPPGIRTGSDVVAG